MSAPSKSRNPLAKLEGKFVPSVWWGRGVRLLARVRRKPVAVQSPPPPTGRWAPPRDQRPAEPKQADIRRMNRLGRRAKLSGMPESTLATPAQGSRMVVHRHAAAPDQPHSIPRGAEDNVP